MTDILPNPGSKEAIAQGCICPVLDKRNGAGLPNGPGNSPIFWYSSDCPVHTSKTLYED